MFYSHTFFIEKHMGMRTSQNASYTGAVCDLYLRLIATPHICMICGIFHTGLNTSLAAMLHPHLLIKRQKGLNVCIQVQHFSPCDTNDDISISGIEAPPIYQLSVKMSPQVCGMAASNEEKLQDFTTF